LGRTIFSSFGELSEIRTLNLFRLSVSMPNHAVTILRDLVFAETDGMPLGLDLYLPATTQPPPLVVWIHGGGWREGSKARPPVARLTEHGFALASISYRLTQQAIFPAQIHDCKAAVRWLRAHQHHFGYDAQWLAAVGGSSGGQLAMLLGTSHGVADLEGELGEDGDQSSQVQAVVSYFGPSDFVLRGRTQPEIAYTEKSGSFALLGGITHGRVLPELEVAASPIHYVSPESPPLLLYHGEADELVRIDQSEAMFDAYRRLGLPVQLVRIPTGGHGGAIFFWGEQFETLRRFLTESHQAWHLS
jgi:acetyl esterase/lipase